VNNEFKSFANILTTTALDKEDDRWTFKFSSNAAIFWFHNIADQIFRLDFLSTWCFSWWSKSL